MDLMTSIRALGVIHSGETLLLSTEGKLTVDEIRRIKNAIEDEMPGVHVVIVTGLQVTVLRDG